MDKIVPLYQNQSINKTPKVNYENNHYNRLCRAYWQRVRYEFFHEKGFNIIGIDNDMRAYFFGKEASTAWVTDTQKERLTKFRLF